MTITKRQAMSRRFGIEIFASNKLKWLVQCKDELYNKIRVKEKR